MGYSLDSWLKWYFCFYKIRLEIFLCVSPVDNVVSSWQHIFFFGTVKYAPIPSPSKESFSLKNFFVSTFLMKKNSKLLNRLP